MRNFLAQHAGYNGIDATSEAIVHAYDLLSRQIHQVVNRKELIIADDLLRREQSIILSFIAFKLNIKFASSWMDLRTIEEHVRPTRRIQ